MEQMLCVVCDSHQIGSVPNEKRGASSIKIKIREEHNYGVVVEVDDS